MLVEITVSLEAYEMPVIKKYCPDTTGFYPKIAQNNKLQQQSTNTELCLLVITVKKLGL